MLFFPEPFGCCRHTHWPSTRQACSKNNDTVLKKQSYYEHNSLMSSNHAYLDSSLVLQISFIAGYFKPDPIQVYTLHLVMSP